MSFSSLKNYLLIILICLLPCSLSAYETEDCLVCHSDNPGEGIPQIPFSDFSKSIHGSIMTCSGCHSYIDEDHEYGETAGRVDCAECHMQKNLHGVSSEKENKPECYSCHTKHRIFPASFENSSVNPERFKDTCAECHLAEWGNYGYLRWFTSIRIRSHKKQDFSREFSERNCTGCHQGMAIHGEPDVINDYICYRCHLNNNRNGLMGRFHAGKNSGSFILGLSISTQILILIILLSAVGLFTRKRRKKSGKNGE